LVSDQAFTAADPAGDHNNAISQSGPKRE
jgi:hypothetical protein